MLQVVSLIKRNILLILFISFLLFLILFTYKDYGIPWDEKVFFSVGKYYAAELFNFLHLPTNLSANGFIPTPYHVLGHGVFMDMLTVFAGLLFPNFTFETLHLIRALFAIPIFILVYWIVSRLISKVYGLIAVVLLLLFPRFYPEIFYNAVDVPTALLFTLSLAYFIYYARTKQTILKSLLFGIILALTINQRLLLLFLPLVNFVFLLIIQRKNLKQFAIRQFVILSSTIIFMHLTHPYLLSHPITGLFDMIKSAKQYPWNAAVLFDGQFYQTGVNPLPWYYLIKTIIITTPLFMIVLFIVGHLSLLPRFFNKKTTTSRLIIVYSILVFYIPLLLNFLLKPTLYDSWRHFLFLTISLIIIATEGLHLLLANKKLQIANPKEFVQYLTATKNHTVALMGKGIAGVIVLTCMGYAGIQMINLHPYEYLYYNSLVGGLKGAHGKYETDYWGLGYKDAVLWFNKNVNNPKKMYKIFVEGDPLSSTTYFKPNMLLTTNVNDADYIFTFTRWNFHERHTGKTIHKVEKEGVPTIFIKKL